MSNKFFMALVAIALAAPVIAQDAAPKEVSTSEKATVTATVTKVDSANRILSLKGPKGDVVDVEVDPVVKRFPEIKVGDMLTVTYHESLVLRVEKANSSAALSTSVEESLVPAKGEKPAGVAKRTIKATVAVDSIDLAKREITVHNSDGSAQTFHIRDPKNVEGVKPGDKITVTYSEAVAMAVTAPAAKN